MKVELLTHTPDPLHLMYAQTRGTTTSQGFATVFEAPARFFPKAARAERDQLVAAYDDAQAMEGLSAAHDAIDALDRREMIRVVMDAIEAGHLSVTRSSHFTFSFTVSRSTGRQMLRSVVGVSWEEMSQRYVKLLNWEYAEALDGLIEESVNKPSSGALVCEHLARVFEVPEHIQSGKPMDIRRWARVRLEEITAYLGEIDRGAKAEDARENLPNCTLTQMIGTFSFEALKHFLAKRLCTRAQAPIRGVAKEMRKLVLSVIPWAAPALAIQCIPSGICPESRPDGCALLLENGGRILRKKHAKDVLDAYVRQQKGSRE